MLQTAQEVYTRARTKIGKLARRHDRPLLTPTESDEDALEIFLEDVLTTICTETDRMSTSIQIDTVADQEWVALPPYVDRIDQANVIDPTPNESFTMTVHAGSEVAQWGRNPAAETGRPEYVGVWDRKIYLFKVPDDVYTLDLQVTYNGAVGTSPPGGVQDPPQLDTMVARVPHELDEALTAYLVAQWFFDVGEPEVAAGPWERFQREVMEHETEPVDQSTSTVPYNMIGP